MGSEICEGEGGQFMVAKLVMYYSLIFMSVEGTAGSKWHMAIARSMPHLPWHEPPPFLLHVMRDKLKIMRTATQSVGSQCLGE